MKWHCRDRWDIASEHCLGKEDHNKKNIRKGKQTPSTRKVTESYTWRVKHSIFRAVVGRSAVKPAAVEILNHLFFCWFWFFPWSANASAMSVHSTGGTQTWNTIKPYIFLLPKRRTSEVVKKMLCLHNYSPMLTPAGTRRNDDGARTTPSSPTVTQTSLCTIVNFIRSSQVKLESTKSSATELVFGTFMSIYWDSNCSD